MRGNKQRLGRYIIAMPAVAFGLYAAVAGGGAVFAADASAKTATVETQTVNVGVLPIADVAPLYLGIAKGFFAKENLDVQPHLLQGGAAVASAVIGGSLQFGFGATANLVLAKAQNLPLEFVANGDQAASKPAHAWSGILVNKNSGINSISQLAGKTIAVNALDGENELALDSILRSHHMSPTSVTVVAIPFGTMPSALASGQVQAVTESEPFVGSIEGSGGKLLSPLFEGMKPSMLVAGYFADTQEITSDPSLVKRFVVAINKSLDYAQAHPKAVRNIIPTYAGIPNVVANSIELPAWGSVLQTSSILFQEKLMQTLGWITSIVPVNQLVWSGAKTQAKTH